MGVRLEYTGPLAAIQVQVGAGRFVSVRNALDERPGADGEPVGLPESVKGLPSSLEVTDEFAATLLPLEGDEESAVWRKAGGKVSKDAQLADDRSAPSLRWVKPEGRLLVEPETGYVSQAELARLDAELRESGQLGPDAPLIAPSTAEGAVTPTVAPITDDSSPAKLAEQQVDTDPAGEAGGEEG